MNDLCMNEVCDHYKSQQSPVHIVQLFGRILVFTVPMCGLGLEADHHVVMSTERGMCMCIVVCVCSITLIKV